MWIRKAERAASPDTGTFPKTSLKISPLERNAQSENWLLPRACNTLVSGELLALILFRLREAEFPWIKVILIYPFEGFTSCWTDDQKKIYSGMLSQYDKCVCVSPVPSRESYLTRDRYMIDGSSHCIAYCTRDTGGTAYTIRYAHNKGGVSIHNVALDGMFC